MNHWIIWQGMKDLSITKEAKNKWKGYEEYQRMSNKIFQAIEEYKEKTGAKMDSPIRLTKKDFKN